MRLSSEAMVLLDAGNVAALQAMNFKELIHPSDFEEYDRQCADPLKAVSASQSLPPHMQDILDLDSIREAVVVSSGFIYSREPIISHLNYCLVNDQECCCPLSRKRLKTDCYGDDFTKDAYIRLPQIDAAINGFRLLRNEARAKAGILMPAVSDQVSPNLNTIMEALASHPEEVQLKLIVTKNIFIIEIANSGKLLRPFFTSALNNPRSEISEQTYLVKGYGRCWYIDEDPTEPARLEFWLNDRAQRGMNDEDLLKLLKAFLAPLDLPMPEEDPNVVPFSITALAPNGEAELLPKPISTSLQKATQCCLSFLNTTIEIARDRGEVLRDEIQRGNSNVMAQSIHYGFVTFGGAGTASGSGFTATQTPRF